MQSILQVLTLLAFTSLAKANYYYILPTNFAPIPIINPFNRPTPAPIDQVLSFNESYQIAPKTKSLFSNLGIINPLRQCGGSGKLLRWRAEACNSNNHGPCVFPAGQYYGGEVTFIPSQKSESLGVRSILKDAQRGVDITTWQNPQLPNSSVEKGKEYVLTSGVSAVPELQGKLITAQILIYRESDKKTEVCAEADFFIV